MTRKGKRFAGDKFPSVKTEEDVRHEIALDKEHGKKPSAIDLATYFSIRGIQDTVRQAAMKGFTELRRATPEMWDDVFKAF